MNATIEFRNITKVFPGVTALDHVGFKVVGGEVAALVGENGAGKSTLLKILSGDYHQDGGEYLINDVPCYFKNPHEAIQAGISVISQERQIVPGLNVAENIFMEDLPIRRDKLVDRKRLLREATEIIQEFNLPIMATDQVKDLSVAYQQMVEIMKAYRRQPKIIAFDEPTASLSDAEIESLFRIIGKLKQEKIIILYVSHRMKEIFQITDKVIIMKDGKFVTQMNTKETEERQIIKLMVGRDLGDVFNKLQRGTVGEKTVLKVEHLSIGKVSDISFELKEGEILGFAGLVGAGRTETVRAIYGADKYTNGNIYINGEKISVTSPEVAIDHGIVLCPEDRKEQGLLIRSTTRENISLGILKRLSHFGFLDFKTERAVAKNGVEELNIRTPSIEKRIFELSGGNQQKVILARWLATAPRILILDEPTKGIDVGSKSEIYQMMCELTRKGISIIFISSELPEILGLSDRIIVMCEGHITGELLAKEANEEKVLMLAMADMLKGKKQ